MTADILSLLAEIRRLQVELAVRTSNPASPRFQCDVPERFNGQRSAFQSGYEQGWRNLEYVNAYSSSAHIMAFRAGYLAGEAESLEAIGRFLIGTEGAPKA